MSNLMGEDLNSSLRKICTLLDKYHVEYLIIGGTAVALHGYYRESVNISGELSDKPDIDIWYNPTYENYFNILKVIKELGQDTEEFGNEQQPNPLKSFFKLDFVDFSLDILPVIKADIKFLDANKRKETMKLEESQIYIMSYLDLIADKKATARNKDIEDIKQLKKIRGEE